MCFVLFRPSTPNLDVGLPQVATTPKSDGIEVRLICLADEIPRFLRRKKESSD